MPTLPLLPPLPLPSIHRAAPRVALGLALGLGVPLGAAGCKGDKAEEKAAEAEPAKEEPAAKRDPETSLDKVVKGPDLSGPVPPETSMVFFAIDGALIPLACFDKDKGSLAAGKDCLPLAPKGADVYLKSAFSDQLDTLGDPKSALCEVGASTPTSVSTPATDGGAAFDWAASPKSAARNVVPISSDTWKETTIKFTDAEKKAVAAAIVGIERKTADLEVHLHQAAGLDLDGDGAEERLFSAYVINPRDTARYLFSGVFLARGSAPDTLHLVEKTKTSSEIFKVRGAVDLDGDGTHELWLNASFDEGGGDRIYVWKGEKFTGLGSWTCGL